MARRSERTARRMSPALVTAVVAAAVVLGVVVIWAGSRAAPGPGTPPAAVAGAVDTRLGKADAPVRVEFFLDFQCSHCKTAADQSVPPLIRDYVETGKVELVYRFFPKLGPESVAAAGAAACAADQGQFWPYHDQLFAAQRGVEKGAFAPARLQALAGTVGLDTAAWARCLEDDATRQRIVADLNAGQQAGVRGTPSFLVSAGNAAQLIEGAVPYTELKKAVDAALSR